MSLCIRHASLPPQSLHHIKSFHPFNRVLCDSPDAPELCEGFRIVNPAGRQIAVFKGPGWIVSRTTVYSVTWPTL